MREQEIEKKINNDLIDLGTEDILCLMKLKRFKEAESLGKFLGISEKEIKEIIRDYKKAMDKAELSLDFFT